MADLRVPRTLPIVRRAPSPLDIHVTEGVVSRNVDGHRVPMEEAPVTVPDGDSAIALHRDVLELKS